MNIPPHLKRVATLPCEIFVLINRNDPGLYVSEANFHARLSHSKQLLNIIHSMILGSLCSMTKIYLHRIGGGSHLKGHSGAD